MYAARRLKSGTGDEEKGWNRSSELNLNDDCSASFSGAAAAVSGWELVVKALALESGSVTRTRSFVLSDLEQSAAFRAVVAHGFAGIPAAIWLRKTPEQWPHRLDAALRIVRSILERGRANSRWTSKRPGKFTRLAGG